jgi:hypothetical protein
MKKEQPSLSSDSIVEQLQQWFEAQPGEKMNPLLDLAGIFTLSVSQSFTHAELVFRP